MMDRFYVEVPVYDPANEDVRVELHAQGGGQVLAFLKYSIMHGQSEDFQSDLFGIDFDLIKKPEDIMPTIEPYILSFLKEHVRRNKEKPYEITEIENSENEILDINGYTFNKVKGIMKVKMTDLQIIDLHFYGYFTMFEDYPLFFMSTSQDEAVRDESVEVLDGMMKTFREKRDGDK